MPKVNYPHDEFTENWGDKLAQIGLISLHAELGALSKENGDFLDHTLIHGDYHVNNFMMDMNKDGNGNITCDAKGIPHFVVMDWQDLTSGSGLYDLTYFMTFSADDGYRR